LFTFSALKIGEYSVVAPRTGTLSSEEGVGSTDSFLKKKSALLVGSFIQQVLDSVGLIHQWLAINNILLQ